MYIVLVTISDVSRVVGLERDSGHSENARKRTSTKSEDHLHQMETLTLDVVDSEESRRHLDEMISSIAGLVTMDHIFHILAFSQLTISLIRKRRKRRGLARNSVPPLLIRGR